MIICARVRMVFHTLAHQFFFQLYFLFIYTYKSLSDFSATQLNTVAVAVTVTFTATEYILPFQHGSNIPIFITIHGRFQFFTGSPVVAGS
jgi:hypothetical protein